MTDCNRPAHSPAQPVSFTSNERELLIRIDERQQEMHRDLTELKREYKSLPARVNNLEEWRRGKERLEMILGRILATILAAGILTGIGLLWKISTYAGIAQ